MWFLALKNFSAKSVEKWPKFGQKTLSRSKKGQKCGFGPEIFFQPNWSKNGQKTLSMCFFATQKNSAKMVKKWLKHGQKMFSRPKRIEKVVLGLKKIRSNWSENGQNMATHTHTHTCLDMSLLVYGKILQPFSYAHLTDCGLF